MTPTQVTTQRQAGQRIAPGIWIDRRGFVHFSIPELLAMLGIADTPKDRAICADLVRAFVHGRDPKATIIEQDEGTDG